MVSRKESQASQDHWPAPARRAARSYPKGDRRRAAILQTAFQAFGTVGYRNASMVQIAADCGVSRAGLLHHFPSKELLLQAVLQERDRVDEQRFFTRWIAEGDGLTYLQGMVDLVEYNQAHPGIVSLFAILSTEATDPTHPAHEYFAGRYQRVRADARAAVRDLARRGLLRAPALADGLDVELIALIDGLQIQWLHAPDAIDMAARLRVRLTDLLTVPLG